MRTGVIGSGIAGLTAAMVASERGDEVVLLTKGQSLKDSASSWAQGGIVYQGKVGGSLLKKDMLKVSNGMAYEDHIDLFVKEAPRKLKEILIDRVKVPFARVGSNSNEFDLTEEAAHQEKRILHSKDNTGEVIIKSLIDYLQTDHQIEILTSHILIDLINLPHHSDDPLAVYDPIRCVGGYFLDLKNQKVKKIFFEKTILASGGIGQIYARTTNPPIATGDGIAAAYRSGARVINMEFTQFHPTSLSVKKSNSFLVSEALRGEGAVLVNERGEDFMRRYHRDGSLAPRDIVARAIREEQMKTDGEIYLSLKEADFDFAQRFPTIYQKCVEKKINFSGLGIPVTPAFHFSCGGILSDDRGRTSIANLFAVGECACTGIHGANRLASTSLLEGFFFALRAAEAEIEYDKEFDPDSVNDWKVSDRFEKVDVVMTRKDFQQLKLIMWNYVGIVRKKVYLQTAIQELTSLLRKVEERYRVSRLDKELIELRNAVQIGLLVADSAIKNRKSSGCHYLVD